MSSRNASHIIEHYVKENNTNFNDLDAKRLEYAYIELFEEVILIEDEIWCEKHREKFAKMAYAVKNSMLEQYSKLTNWFGETFRAENLNKVSSKTYSMSEVLKDYIIANKEQNESEIENSKHKIKEFISI